MSSGEEERGGTRCPKPEIPLLTYSMVQSPSWKANWFAASQEIPRISRNPKVHYRTHKRPPPVPILGPPNPVHIPTSHLLEIHPNIIHPSTPRSPQWSPSLRFPHQDPIHPTVQSRLQKCWPRLRGSYNRFRNIGKKKSCWISNTNPEANSEWLYKLSHTVQRSLLDLQ